MRVIEVILLWITLCSNLVGIKCGLHQPSTSPYSVVSNEFNSIEQCIEQCIEQ